MLANNNNSQSNGIPFLFQASTLSVSVFIMLFLIAGELKEFCSIDEAPFITPITPQALKQFTTTPVTVKTGFNITEIPQFDVTGNNFTYSGIIWFYFNPSLISLATISKFSFLRGEIIYLSEPEISLDGDMLLVRYDIKVAFKTSLYYGFFPFEDHKVFLTLVNKTVNPGELLYESQSTHVIIPENIFVAGWRYFNHEVSSGFYTTTIRGSSINKKISYPAVLYEVDFFHESARYVISIILPLIIIFLIDMFSFCLDQRDNKSTLIQLSTANIIALFAYRFVIENIAPKIGYPMLADFIFFTFLSSSFITFLINCIGPYLTRAQRRYCSVGVQALVVMVFMYLFTVWVPC